MILKEQRKRKILCLIEKNQQVHIAELSDLFNVSEMTIRRDLDDLADKKLIQRIHGGAVFSGDVGNKNEPPVMERCNEQEAEKQLIARKMAEIVQDGEKIFLGSGTTTLAIAEALKDHQDLTVITNAITIVNCLLPATHIKLVVMGGFLRRTEMSMIGHFTDAGLANLQVDRVIIGIRGIDLAYGLTSDHLQELTTDQAILKISDEIIVAADHTKFGHIAAIRTAPITVATKIVTDAQAPASLDLALAELGIELVRATES